MGKKAKTVDWVKKGKMAVERFNDCTFFYDRSRETPYGSLPEIFDTVEIAWRVRPTVPGETLDGDGSDLRAVEGSEDSEAAMAMWDTICKAVSDGRCPGNEWVFDILAQALAESKQKKDDAGGGAGAHALPKALKAGDVWVCPETGLSYDVKKHDGANISCEVCSFADDMNCPLTPEGLCLCLYDQPEKEHEIYFVARPVVREVVEGDVVNSELGIVNSESKIPNPKSLIVSADYQMIGLGLIDASPYQPGTARGDPARDPEVVELAESIKAVGLCEPMVVRPKAGGRFELIAGHRRLSACRLAGLEAEKCVVRDVDDTQAEKLHFVENLQRKDLTAIEEAREVSAMIARGYKPDEIAEATGKSVRWVYRRASITSLDPAWQGAADMLKLSAAFLERVGRLPLKIQADVYASMGVEDAIVGKEAFADVDFQRGGDCAELDKHIKAQLREIGAAPWESADSVTESKCSGCPDRTDTAADLFEEYEGSPRCLNAKCWEKRLETFVTDARKGLKKEHAQVIEATSRNASLYSPTRSQKMSVPVLVTDGPRKGETLWAPGKDTEAPAGSTAAAKVPGKEDKERFAYVKAVRACVESAREPEWAQEDGEPVCVPHAALVAFACGCGVSGHTLVSGAYTGALPRSLAILAVLEKAGTLDAERAALWLAARPNVLSALELDEDDFDAAAWLVKEAHAQKVRDAFRIPPGLVNGFYAEFKPKVKGKK